jgi:hypothetical protein
MANAVHGDSRYLALTTYRRDGRPVTTPVWSVALEGKDELDAVNARLRTRHAAVKVQLDGLEAPLQVDFRVERRQAPRVRARHGRLDAGGRRSAPKDPVEERLLFETPGGGR